MLKILQKINAMHVVVKILLVLVLVAAAAYVIPRTFAASGPTASDLTNQVNAYMDLQAELALTDTQNHVLTGILRDINYAKAMNPLFFGPVTFPYVPMQQSFPLQELPSIDKVLGPGNIPLGPPQTLQQLLENLEKQMGITDKGGPPGDPTGPLTAPPVDPSQNNNSNNSDDGSNPGTSPGGDNTTDNSNYDCSCDVSIGDLDITSDDEDEE